MSDILVVGAGAWGTALAVHLAGAGRDVALWARDSGLADRRESRHLPGVRLPRAIRVTHELGTAPLTLLAIPAQHLRAVAAGLPARGRMLVCAKGVEIGTSALPLEIVAALRPGVALGVLTGPNFAHEVARGLPAAAVVAADDPALRDDAIAALSTPSFRLYGNDDPIGAQLGGAAKNVIAIAAGVVIGAGLGENARAALVTRGLAEMARLAVALGGRAETVAGLSGMGDLLLTCAGSSSRNMSFGFALGAGAEVADILAARDGVTEGVATAPALVARAAGLGVEVPVCEAVARLVTGRISVVQASEALLSRPLRDE